MATTDFIDDTTFGPARMPTLKELLDQLEAEIAEEEHYEQLHRDSLATASIH